MCNELLKKAVRFHFYDICGRNIYTTLQFPAPRITIYVQLVLKRTKQPEIIRCLVILPARIFLLRITPNSFLISSNYMHSKGTWRDALSRMACTLAVRTACLFHKSLYLLRIEFCQSAFGCLAISARQIAAGFVHSLHDQVEGDFTSTGKEIR